MKSLPDSGHSAKRKDLIARNQETERPCAASSQAHAQTGLATTLTLTARVRVCRALAVVGIISAAFSNGSEGSLRGVAFVDVLLRDHVAIRFNRYRPSVARCPRC